MKFSIGENRACHDDLWDLNFEFEDAVVVDEEFVEIFRGLGKLVVLKNVPKPVFRLKGPDVLVSGILNSKKIRLQTFSVAQKGFIEELKKILNSYGT